MLGGTDHELTPESTGRIGRVEVCGHGWAHDRVQRFMDGILKAQLPSFEGAGTLADDLRETPRVQYFAVGRNEWRSADDWPPAGVDLVACYLRGDGTASPGTSAGGSLDTTPPGDEAPDRYAYDPADPVTAWVGHSVWSMADELTDRRTIEERPDVLVYTGPSLTDGLEVTGPVQVRLFAASSARDTDFTAALVDVFPDGYAQLVWEGIVRARYRESERRPSLIEPGRVYQYTIDLASVSYLFADGHRVRLEVSSSNFDRYDRNQNTGEEYGVSARIEVAQQTVFHDGERPSRVLLPVFRGD